MQKQKVFISSVQSEFATERKALCRHFQTDALLSNFFEPIIFEKLPAAAQAPNNLYMSEIDQSEVFLILLGEKYGYEDENGVSPTEQEYHYARKLKLDCLAFIKGDSSVLRHVKEEALLLKVQAQLSYKRFESTTELIAEVNKAFVTLLKRKGLITTDAFDERINDRATFQDIDPDRIETFIGVARHRRGFPLREGTPVKKVLAHMNMLRGEKLINSALLAFCGNPERFFPTAIVKCAHFHGLHVQKPIPDQKVIKGDVFEQVDQSVDFVLSKISLSVGTRELSTQAPVQYEIPPAVVAEAIVNAVAHRDYNSNGSVQVMLFADRLEVSNPGRLDPELSIEKLKTDHASYPTNPLLAEPLYQAGYIERYGTGTGDILAWAKSAGLKEPVFTLDEGFKVMIWRPMATTGPATDPATDHVTDHVTDQATDQVTDQATDQADELVKRLIIVLSNEKSRQEILAILALRHSPNFRDNYLIPAIDQGFVEMTIPDKPNSPNQKYRLTPRGIDLRNKLEQK